MNTAEVQEFRELCASAGLAVTHQRQVVFEALRSMPGHPSADEVYARVKREVPSISLATVYKNIHLFVENGLFGQVSQHHGSLRIETNSRPHYHLVCRRCKSIQDIGANDLDLVEKRGRLLGDFLAERYSVDVLGLCAACQEKPVANV